MFARRSRHEVSDHQRRLGRRVAARRFLRPLVEALEPRVVLDAGDLDQTFGTNGIAAIPGATQVNDVAIQADGRTVAVGADGDDFTIARFNLDGTPDASFGNNGVAAVDFRLGPDAANAVSLLADGRILVVGEAFVEAGSVGGFSKFAMARLNADGTLDQTFGVDGKVVENFRGNNEAWDVELLPNGQFLVGSRFFYGTFDLPASAVAVVRYNADGTRDATFGDDGVASVEILNEVPNERRVGLGVQSTGRIILAVGRDLGNDDAVGLFGFDTSGDLDATFGNFGSVITNPTIDENDIPEAVVIQPDDKIVVGATAEFPDRFLVLRYNANGSLDDGTVTDTTIGDTFGAGGFVKTDFPTGSNEEVFDLALQNNGQIVVFGAADVSDADPDDDRDWALARYNVDGTLDTVFGTNGLVTLQTGGFKNDGGIAIQADNKLVVGSASDNGFSTQFTLARFEGDLAPGEFEFDSANYFVDENAGTVTITVTRTGGTDGAVSVVAETLPNGGATATPNVDYTATTITLNFGDEVSVQTFSIPILDNAAAEGNETVNLNLRTPTGGAAIGGQGTAVLNIFDGPGQFQFSLLEYETNEDAASATIEITRTGGSDGAVSVTLTTANGTATAGADFTNTTGPVSFADEQTTRTVMIPLLDDNLLEGPETVRLILSSPSAGATLGTPSQATLRIFDVEPGVGLNAGALDQFFATGGVSTTDLGTMNFQVHDMVRQADGKFVLVGDRVDPADFAGPRDFFVTRLNNDGTLDTTFGTNGVVVTDFGGGEDSAQAVTLQGTNIVVAGYSVLDNHADFALARYTTSGALDATFDTDGRVTTNFGAPGFTLTDDRAFDVAVDPSNRIVVVGSTGNIFLREFAVARYNNNGSLDSSFDSDGRASTDFENSFDEARTVAVTATQIIVAGRARVTRSFEDDLAIAVYSAANGSLDNGFSTDGLLFADPRPSDNIGNDDDIIRDVLVQPDGKIVVIGESDQDFLVGRFNPDGTPDRNFGDRDGIVTSGFVRGSDSQTSFDSAFKGVLQPDGKLLVAGTSDFDTALARYDQQGRLDLTFGTGGLATTAAASGAVAVALEPNANKIITAGSDNGNVQIARFQAESACPLEGCILFTNFSFSTFEGATNFEVTVRRTSATGSVTVDFESTDGTATANSDYTPVSGTLVFNDGQDTASFEVPILQETVEEFDESINLILSNATGGAELGSQNQAVLTILENDQVSTPVFSVFDVTVQENGGVVTVTVERSDNHNGTATVDFATSNGTATEGQDYLPRVGTLTFADGVTEQSFDVPIIADTFIEEDETFIVTLSNATGDTVLSNFSDTATVTILDADPNVCTNAGELDDSFDGDGIVTTDVGGNFDEINVIQLLPLPGGQILAAGESSQGTINDSRLSLVKYNSNGSIDTNFGVNGRVLTDIGNDQDRAFGIHVLGDGDILVFGASENDLDESYLFVRYNSNGTLDTAFGNGGSLLYRLEGVEFGVFPEVFVQSNGQFVVAEEYFNGTDDDIALVRFNSNGLLDTTFGDGGLVTLEDGFSSDFVQALGVDGSGKILLSGGGSDLQRFNANGTLDTTFGTNGSVVSDFGNLFVSYETILVQPDGKILAVGDGFSFDSATGTFLDTFAVARYNSNGSLDDGTASDTTPEDSFGTGGLAQIGFGGGFSSSTSAALLADGRIVVAGSADSDFALARFYPDGVVDIGFGANGRVITNIGGFDQANDVVETAAGRILAAGDGSNNFALAQYVGGTAPGQFRFDAAAFQVNEDGGNIAIEVRRVCGADGPVSVEFATSDGSAIQGTDYTTVVQRLNFADRQTVQTITVPITDDNLAQGNLDFDVELRDAQGGAGLAVPAAATVTIVDDESPGQIQFTSITYTATETDGNAVITLERLVGQTGAVTAQVVVTGGTATAGQDFTGTTFPVNFADGEESKTISIPLNNDALTEGDETVNLALQNPTGGATLGFRANAILTLEDPPIFDFGDAPAPYPTTLAENGARHAAAGLTLGANRDSEANGSHSATASADDTTGVPDDEDGVTFGTVTVGALGATATVNVAGATGGARLDAWIDFNGDGSWGGPAEQIASGVTVVNGNNTIAFDVPSEAKDGTTFARFRLSTVGNFGPEGIAADGEVEDYAVTVTPPLTACGAFGGQNLLPTGPLGASTPFSVFAADVDGDGDLDALSASQFNDEIAWYENDGSQNFTAHSISLTADGAVTVFAADVDGDGDLDALSASLLDSQIAWYENDGNENFTPHTITTQTDFATDVFAADVDGDGDIDVLSASLRDDKLAWYENDGSQNFTPHTISTAISGANTAYAVDLDGDGDLDVITASYADDQIVWFENDGSQNFAPHTVTLGADGAATVIAADVDGDGDLDVLSASVNDDKIAWYENDGSQSFTSRTISTAADGAINVTAGDIDGDGDLDVLSASMLDDKIAWYENDGNQNFAPHTINTTSEEAQSVVAADVDGDGDLDVFSASFRDNKIAWYESLSCDFGDAPAPYPVLLTANGARHGVGADGPFLGGLGPDAEADGQPSATAVGDDSAGTDDEDADEPDPVTLVAGQPATGWEIGHDGGTATSGAVLSGWIDLNDDGDWNDTGEQFLADVAVPSGPGSTSLDSITIPADATLGTTFVRLRISTQTGLAPTGVANDGEVEDFPVTIVAPPCSLAVTNTLDGGAGSLREAIICANETPGADTIIVPAGTYTLTITGLDEDHAATGDLDVTDDLTIQAASGLAADDVIIQAGTQGFNDTGGANGIDRVLNVPDLSGGTALPSTNLTLVNLTIQHGNVAGFGGGILFESNGTLNLTGVALTDNTSSAGGGIYNTGTLNVTESSISSNFAGADGGGIFNALNGIVNVIRSTLAVNTAVTEGGGLWNSAGTVNITNSTISRNQTTDSNGEGGGIYQGSQAGQINLVNVTVLQNRAGVLGSGGGGLFTDGTGTIRLQNTVVARNQRSTNTPSGGEGSDVFGSFISDGNNLIGNTEGATGFGSSDLRGNSDAPIDPRLDGLADNGGPTLTHLPQPNSPVRDAGSDAVLDPPHALTTDQRGSGFARRVGVHVDIGAVEFVFGNCDLEVDTTNDIVNAGDASNSLREAILCANALPGTDTITFNIPGFELHTILPTRALPVITDPVIIDGYTQLGASPNTNPITEGSNATLRIELDGNIASDGLVITGGNSTIRGLAINRFAHGIQLSERGGNVIEGNFLGTNAAGTVARPNFINGVHVLNSPGNRIGGTTPASRNLISGNFRHGIRIRGNSDNNLVQGNLIGTNVSGMQGLGNGESGITLDGVENNTIGGVIPAARNVISANGTLGLGDGIELVSGANLNLVQGNFIGLDVTGTQPLGNTRIGIAIASSNDNIIGGAAAGAGNVISANGSTGITIGAIGSASRNTIQGNRIGTDVTGLLNRGNGQAGLLIDGGLGTTIRDNVVAFNSTVGIGIRSGDENRILSNSIVSNGELGIDLVGGIEDANGVTLNDPLDADTGAPNKLQNYPTLTSAVTDATTVVTGTFNSLPSRRFRIEFFSSVQADPSGFGEGRTFLGFSIVDTNPSGDATINFVSPTSVTVGEEITSTATLVAAGSEDLVETSEFSNAIDVVGPPPKVADLQLTKTVDDPTPNLGAIVQFTITLTNAGPDPATNVQVKDLIPAGLSNGIVATNTGSFAAGTGIWTVPSLAATPGSNTATLTITAEVTASNTTLTNTAEVIASGQIDSDSTADNSDPNEDDQDSVSITIPAAADLELIKVVNNSAAQFGDTVTFTVTLTNAGPDTATNVEVTERLPAGLSNLTFTPSTGTYDSSTNVWSVATLSAATGSNSATLTITAILDTADPLNNVAEVTAADQFDPDSTPGNNVPSEDDQFAAGIGLCLTGGPLQIGLNRLIYSCVTPSSISAFVMGTTLGSRTLAPQGVSVTTEVADAQIKAFGIADSNGVAVVFVEVTEEQAGQTLIFQAFEFRPEVHLSNTLILGVLETPLSATTVGSGGPQISADELTPLVGAALSRWSAVGLTPQQVDVLSNLSVSVSDLPGGYIGVSIGNSIVLDRDAAGNGWYRDSTPLDDDEFVRDPSTGRWESTATNAQGRLDVLTVLMHEFGHALGLSDLPASVGPDHLMSHRLDPGVRRLPVSHTNWRMREDVNRDGQVSPLDALIIINILNGGSGWSVDNPPQLLSETGEPISIYPDVNADSQLAPIDALNVINYLNTLTQQASFGEGEGPAAGPPRLDDSSDPAWSRAVDAVFAQADGDSSRTVRPSDQRSVAADATAQAPHSSPATAAKNTSPWRRSRRPTSADAELAEPIVEELARLLGNSRDRSALQSLRVPKVCVSVTNIDVCFDKLI